MAEGSQDMLAFLGVKPDRGLLAEDQANLPPAERPPEPVVSTHEHDRLVAAGSLLTAITLIGGVAMVLFGGLELVVGGGGVLDAVIALIGLLLAGTHWGWVHVAEYAGLTIDERHERANEELRQEWLKAIEPYPRFSVSTGVLEDASTRVQRILHQPVLTPQHTFTFARRVDAEEIFDAHAPAEVIASGVETMRRQGRLETDRLRENWEAASTAYQAALQSADDERQELAAQRAAATALSEHINASLLEPPLVE
jgi:hypothetical protein